MPNFSVNTGTNTFISEFIKQRQTQPLPAARLPDAYIPEPLYPAQHPDNTKKSNLGLYAFLAGVVAVGALSYGIGVDRLINQFIKNKAKMLWKEVVDTVKQSAKERISAPFTKAKTWLSGLIKRKPEK